MNPGRLYFGNVSPLNPALSQAESEKAIRATASLLPMGEGQDEG
jgi:hypothetical protein